MATSWLGCSLMGHLIVYKLMRELEGKRAKELGVLSDRQAWTDFITSGHHSRGPVFHESLGAQAIFSKPILLWLFERRYLPSFLGAHNAVHHATDQVAG